MYTYRVTVQTSQGHNPKEAIALVENMPASLAAMAPARIFTTSVFTGTVHELMLEWDFEEANDVVDSVRAWHADPEGRAFLKEFQNVICDLNTMRREVFRRHL